MSDAPRPFRGERAIIDIRGRVKPVAEFLATTRPEVTTIVVYKSDYEMLRKWPQAAELAGFTFHDSVPHFGKFTLRTDKGLRGNRFE